MPFPSAHNVLQLFGDITSETEKDIWSCTIRIGDGGVPAGGTSAPAVITALNADIDGDLTTWWNAISEHFNSATRFLGFKFNGVGVDGRYVSTTQTNVKDFVSPKVGSSSGEMLPPQCAIAVTFHTAANRGLAAKGRIYLPAPSVSAMTAGGRLSDTRCSSIAAATATLLTNLSNWPGVDAPDYGSTVVASKVGAGAMRRITGVSVGDRIDTQRRRANNLTEHRSPVSAVST